MFKIYIVWLIDCDEHYIERIFTSYAEAEMYRELLKSRDEDDIYGYYIQERTVEKFREEL